MISFRHADLLDKVNEDKIKELKQTFVRGSIVLDDVQGEIHTVGIDGTQEIKSKIFKAMSNAGFELNQRPDGKFDPYYTLIEDDQAPDAHNVIEATIEFLEDDGFEATYKTAGTRIIIEYQYYPLLKTADLLPRLRPIEHKRLTPVKLNDLQMGFDEGKPVVYVPHHAKGDETHPDTQEGKISSWNHKFVFVNFGKGDTSPACDPNDLLWL